MSFLPFLNFKNKLKILRGNEKQFSENVFGAVFPTKRPLKRKSAEATSVFRTFAFVLHPIPPGKKIIHKFGQDRKVKVGFRKSPPKGFHCQIIVRNIFNYPGAPTHACRNSKGYGGFNQRVTGMTFDKENFNFIEVCRFSFLRLTFCVILNHNIIISLIFKKSIYLLRKIAKSAFCTFIGHHIPCKLQSFYKK